MSKIKYTEKARAMAITGCAADMLDVLPVSIGRGHALEVVHYRSIRKTATRMIAQARRVGYIAYKRSISLYHLVDRLDGLASDRPALSPVLRQKFTLARRYYRSRVATIRAHQEAAL